MRGKILCFLCIISFVFFGTTNVFSATYIEDFSDGNLDTKWTTEGSYTISDGYLHMNKEVNDEHTSSWVRLWRSGELINYLSADIMYAEGVPQITGLALQWWQDPTSTGWNTGMQLHLKLIVDTNNNKTFFASLDSKVNGVSTNLGYKIFDSIVPNAGWNALSIAFNSDSVTVGINDVSMNIFEGINPNPSGPYCFGDALVHGHNGSPSINYSVDNLRAVSQVINTAPVAEAGPNQSIQHIGSTVQLNGTQSYDNDGDPINYQWSFYTLPSGSSAILSGAKTATPTFVADVHGTYIVRLGVGDKWSRGGSDTVTISFENVKPLANAGNSLSSDIFQTVYLNGSGSTDVNGDALTYQWTLASAPQGSAAAIANPTAMSTTLIPDKEGIYVVQLVVNDGFEASEPSSIQIIAIVSPSTVTQYVQQIQSVVLAIPLGDFKNANMRNTLINKLNAVIASIQAGYYVDALTKLENDILGKTDGCAISGAPDKNDWIKACASQAQLYQMVIQTMDLLKNLID